MHEHADGGADASSGFVMLDIPKQSDWQCYMFGSTPGNGIMWIPNEGKVPNAWWRFWQYVVFGNRWVERPKGNYG